MPNICGYLEGQVESAQKNLEVQQGEARALLGPKTQVQLKKTKSALTESQKLAQVNIVEVKEKILVEKVLGTVS